MKSLGERRVSGVKPGGDTWGPELSLPRGPHFLVSQPTWACFSSLLREGSFINLFNGKEGYCVLLWQSRLGCRNLRKDEGREEECQIFSGGAAKKRPWSSPDSFFLFPVNNSEAYSALRKIILGKRSAFNKEQGARLRILDWRRGEDSLWAVCCNGWPFWGNVIHKVVTILSSIMHVAVVSSTHTGFICMKALAKRLCLLVWNWHIEKAVEVLSTWQVTWQTLPTCFVFHEKNDSKALVRNPCSF